MSRQPNTRSAQTGCAEIDEDERRSSATFPGKQDGALLVVGGYGAVGTKLCRQLIGSGLQVIVAGRNLDRARKVAVQMCASSRRLDLDDSTTWAAACEDVSCVVVCMDQSETGFVQFVLGRGINYVDLTANDAFFRQVEALETRNASALLSVGLAPGLTNMLAAHCAAGMDQVQDIEIGLMSAIGDAHGHAGINWLMEQVFDPGKLADGRRLYFGGTWGARMAYRVDFADQHVLRRHLGARTTATRVCLTSTLITAALFRLVQVFRGNRWVKSALSRILSFAQWHAGVCVIAVAVTGIRSGSSVTTHMRFSGTGELEITARIGAEMICAFLVDPPPSGVWHSHQVLDFSRLRQSAAFRSAGFLELGTSERD
jgi:NAD(P)-dependent dehydrogenase (short-subunit alcohol dehydrogenase family)